jgi:hypothetical protein
MCIGVHECEAVAVAALSRIRRCHVYPHCSGEIEALRGELLPGVDGTAQPMVKLVGSPNFPHHHVVPVLGDVTIGTGSPHPGAVAVVHRVPVFTVDVLPHLVAGDAERFPIGELESGVEGSPEENSRHEQTGNRNQWAAGGEVKQQFPPAHHRSITTTGSSLAPSDPSTRNRSAAGRATMVLVR